MKVEEWLGSDNQLGIDIWNKKYRHGEESFDQWLDRVSGGDAAIRQLIVEKKFLFGGRILANRGLDKEGVKVTYSNCYVLAPPEDSIESIFETASKMARTFSYGGGVGVDLSKLAPRGAKINNTAEETSGAVSFTDLYSMVTGLIGQHGRRGALMLSMSCEHPDVTEFMRVKTDLERVTKANMSIRVTDEFMECVQKGEKFTQAFTRPETGDTVTKTIDAREFFKELCDANYDYGEPGCLFWDRIDSWNLLSEYDDFRYAGTNPCAEEPLPAGGSCLLGSLNLAEFVKDGTFDMESFEEAVKISIYALNDVLDEGLELHPLKEQRDSVRDWRQIGLGIMGLADMFIKMGVEYGSARSFGICDKIGFEMARCAILASKSYGLEHGSFPKFDSKKIKGSMFWQKHFGNGRSLSAMANSQLLTIAPTGSISTMLGISGGIEPIFANSYERRTTSLSEHDDYYKVYTPIVKAYMDEHPEVKDETDLPDFFVTAQNLDYKARIDIQATWQKHIDASISSTVNLPEDFPRDKVYDIYVYAWQSGCKGVTVFRDGCQRLGILSTKNTQERGVVETVGNDVIGKKRKLMTGCGSLHCSAFFDPVSGKLKEVFLNKGSTGGCNNYMIGLSRMMSLAARSGCELDDIVGQLKSCGSCPSYAVRRALKNDTSEGSCCPMAVANALLEMRDEMQGRSITKSDVVNPCPKCGAELEFQGGCNVCKSCGWTKCE